ncbi:uncharacterized protein VNE69_07130 [Vairimorpha necatrix]|uniref:Membrane protein n=1 Tax=Vairimorpha necatrix TaxID=6039 RepID=A0AAX4JDX6_9MICR
MSINTKYPNNRNDKFDVSTAEKTNIDPDDSRQEKEIGQSRVVNGAAQISIEETILQKRNNIDENNCKGVLVNFYNKKNYIETSPLLKTEYKKKKINKQRRRFTKFLYGNYGLTVIVLIIFGTFVAGMFSGIYIMQI